MYHNYDNNLSVYQDADLQGMVISMDEGIAGSVASTGYMVNVHDAYHDCRFNRKVEKSGFSNRFSIGFQSVFGAGALPSQPRVHRTAAARRAAANTMDERTGFSPARKGELFSP